MKFLFFILALVFILIKTQDNNLRLLEINNTRIWVHKDQISKYLPKAGELINFVDVTETQNLEKGPIPVFQELPPRPTQQTTVKPLVAIIESQSFDRLVATDKHLSSYRTRHATSDTGVEAVTWIKGEYDKIIASLPDSRKALFTTKFFPHTWKQPSLIVQMKGKTSELVILGGHIDSTASGGVAPGADDDASGSSSVLECFRIIAQSSFIPTKTIEFHAYAAEEMGLLGSRAMAQKYKTDGAKVMGMMQLDMTGYGNAKIGVITNGVDAPLTQFSRLLITEYGKNGFC